MSIMDDIEVATRIPQTGGSKVKFQRRKKEIQLPGDIPDYKPRGPGGFLMEVYDELNTTKPTRKSKSPNKLWQTSSIVDPDLISIDCSNASIEKCFKEHQRERQLENEDTEKSFVGGFHKPGKLQEREKTKKKIENVEENFKKLNIKNAAISSLQKKGAISKESMKKVVRNMENDC